MHWGEPTCRLSAWCPAQLVPCTMYWRLSGTEPQCTATPAPQSTRWAAGTGHWAAPQLATACCATRAGRWWRWTAGAGGTWPRQRSGRPGWRSSWLRRDATPLQAENASRQMHSGRHEAHSCLRQCLHAQLPTFQLVDYMQVSTRQGTEACRVQQRGRAKVHFLREVTTGGRSTHV